MNPIERRLQAIWDLAREGLVHRAVQESEGWLWSDPDRPFYSDEPPDPSWPRRIKDTDLHVHGYMAALGEFLYENVQAPTLTFRGGVDGWSAAMQRSTNPHCFSVYIQVTGKTLEATLDELERRVVAKDWR